MEATPESVNLEQMAVDVLPEREVVGCGVHLSCFEQPYVERSPYSSPHLEATHIACLHACYGFNR